MRDIKCCRYKLFQRCFCIASLISWSIPAFFRPAVEVLQLAAAALFAVLTKCLFYCCCLTHLIYFPSHKWYGKIPVSICLLALGAMTGEFRKVRISSRKPGGVLVCLEVLLLIRFGIVWVLQTQTLLLCLILFFHVLEQQTV